ncbi:MAG TPA: AAA family ATPase [Roseiflexaceae bacterium]|nr:AAA family ATPase [Roseiflexaceae bacterium]
MIHLRSVQVGVPAPEEAAAFPFSVPAIGALIGQRLEFAAPVSFLVGENGSGKSTLLEALAVAAGMVTVGSAAAAEDATLSGVRGLARRMRLSWARRSRRGFFMRSEDFFGFVRRVRAMREGLEQDLREIDSEYAGRSEQARGLARLPILRELGELRSRYGEDLDFASHGESYFTLFKARFVPDGVYMLDEPEAPLSPMRQIGFLAMVRRLVAEEGAQFIIATHSPILMALPEAAIYGFDDGAVRQVRYEETEHYIVTRGFLNSPERFLRHL